MQSFNIPVVLFLFKRIDAPLKIIKEISKIAPKKLYILSDGGRDENEKQMVEECRRTIEAAITWDCEIVRKYEKENIGVYSNIGEGAKWVFAREECAIFLEDDNLPELSFFKFCEEILERYKDDTRILWVCGTNYLKEYSPVDGASYLFTQNMMPCGWASWRDKFLKFYDGELLLWKQDYIRNRIKREYVYKPLYFQDRYNLDYEVDAKNAKGRFYSWDYQMCLSMRANNLHAIVPKYNQIKNIGADLNSTHGNHNINDVMVRRFCDLETRELDFPLKHPSALLVDIPFELATSKIILNPSFFSIRSIFSRFLRKLFGINRTESLYGFFSTRFLGK